MNFSENLGKIRKHFGVSNSGLEKRLGLANGYIGNIEKKGTDNPGKLLMGLTENGISSDWFITGKGSMLLYDGTLPVLNKVEKQEGKVPLLRQKVSCGQGINWNDEQNIEDYVDISSLLPRHRTSVNLYALTAQGSSMLGVGIHDGDILIFDGNCEREKDGTYVFALDGEVYCKRIEYDRFSHQLKIFSVRSENLKEAELLQTLNTEAPNFNERFFVFGKVISWLHNNQE